MRRLRTQFGSGALILAALGCGGEASQEGEGGAESASPTPTASVTILTPAMGGVLESGDVDVTLEVAEIEIAPVAEGRMGTGHHHLFLDVDLTPFDQMVPLDNPQIVHMGDGRSSHVFEGLEPGEHRIIAVLADPTHTPIDPPVVDTVLFRVRD